MSEKRNVSLLIPYKTNGEEIFVFLQKRAKDAKRLPDWFGFFGGGMENNEAPEETLLREIQEEMDFVPEGYELLNSYEFENGLKHVFILEVDDDFENHIKILEGEYGKYFNETEALNEPRLGEEDKIVLKDLYKFLKR